MKHALIPYLTLLLMIAMIASPPLVADQGDPLLAHAYLLVGFPRADAEETPGTLVVPGTVIPIDSRSSVRPAAVDDQDRTVAITELADKLGISFRLSSVDVRYAIPKTFHLGVTEELPGPTPSSPISLRTTLLGASEELASFQVQFQQGPLTLADTKVAIPRGKRAVFGGLDGEEAPYIFLVLEPHKKGTPLPVFVDEGITPPRAITKIPPQYTPLARESRVQGVVIMQAIIETNGQISDVKVLKGLPMGLEEAAVEAIRQWTFDPALDGDGNPVRVYYNLTINFRLQKNEVEQEVVTP